MKKLIITYSFQTDDVLNIGMVDADLLDNGTRFPNLAQMKISAFCKEKGHGVKLILDDDLCQIKNFDILIISKVFTFTKLPSSITCLIDENRLKISSLNNSISEAIDNFSFHDRKGPVILIGGTGFFSDGGKNLDKEIEHIMPDYNLYSDYLSQLELDGKNLRYYKDYTDASIGFLTRGCFRKCEFCVNKKYDRAFAHSPLNEFFDETRPFICLSDDNFLAYPGWEDLLDQLKKTGKPFQFKQGLDIRLLTDKKAKILSDCRYKGEYIFAFDKISDKDLILKKLKIWRKYSKKATKFYVLCAFEPINSWDGISDITDLEVRDIESVFERIEILMKYGCLPYVMRYEYFKNSQFRGMYTQMARWCNQPNIFKKMSFREFCVRNQKYHKSDTKCAAVRVLESFENKYPDIAKKFFNMKYEKLKKY